MDPYAEYPPGLPRYSWTLRDFRNYVFNLPALPPPYTDPSTGATVTFQWFTASTGKKGVGYTVKGMADTKAILAKALGGDPTIYQSPKLTYLPPDTLAKVTIKPEPKPPVIVEPPINMLPPTSDIQPKIWTQPLVNVSAAPTGAIETKVSAPGSAPVTSETKMANVAAPGADIVDVILGGIGGYVTGGIGGAITGALGGLTGGGTTGGETGTSPGVLPTGLGSKQLTCPTGYVLGADGYCKPTAAGSLTLASGCPTGYKWDAGKGQCVKEGVVGWIQSTLPGGKTGTTTDMYGTAVMGAFGKPALVPAVVGQTQYGPILRCPAGAVLGKDDLCYQKGSIPNSMRKWPKPTRPLLTAGDMKTLRRIDTIQNRVKKAWQKAGKPGQARPRCTTRRKR